MPDRAAARLTCISAGANLACQNQGVAPLIGADMSNAAGPLTGSRILLVEDEYLIAMEMERWLRDAGAEVIGPVPSVEQALDLIEDGRLDAAVLDINLGDGERVFPVADRLGALGVPYLFATGDVRILKDPGYEGRPRLEKPILSRELLAAAQRLVHTSQRTP